eukprot:3811533-Prymnesium_polylepis.1
MSARALDDLLVDEPEDVTVANPAGDAAEETVMPKRMSFGDRVQQRISFGLSAIPSEATRARREEHAEQMLRLGKHRTQSSLLKKPSGPPVPQLRHYKTDSEVVKQRKLDIFKQLRDMRVSVEVEKDPKTERRSLKMSIYKKGNREVPLIKVQAELRALLFWSVLLFFMMPSVSGLQIPTANMPGRSRVP